MHSLVNKDLQRILMISFFYLCDDVDQIEELAEEEPEDVRVVGLEVADEIADHQVLAILSRVWIGKTRLIQILDDHTELAAWNRKKGMLLRLAILQMVYCKSIIQRPKEWPYAIPSYYCWTN